MNFILHYGGDLKKDKARELQTWLDANEKEYANSMPDGTKYLGTYFAMFTSDKTGGAVHQLVQVDSYGAQDRLAEAGKQDGLFGKLQNELFSFFDDQSQNWTSALYKSVTDATIFGE